MSVEETQFRVQYHQPFLKVDGTIPNCVESRIQLTTKCKIYFQKLSNSSGSHPKVNNQFSRYNQERSGFSMIFYTRFSRLTKRSPEYHAVQNREIIK